MTGGLHVELEVPLSWRPLYEAERNSILQRSGIVLQLLNLHDAHPPHEEAQGEMRHLEQKLDVIIAMLGLLLEAQAGNGTPVHVRLDSGGLCWQAGDRPDPGAYVLVTLKLAGAPALALPAVAQDAETGMACVRFENLPDALSEQLEKWIFRQHRLAVARSRASRS